MIDTKILVSVCMATYNGGKYIREQVDSILNQEFKENHGVELELVVSDDDSTDDTIQILESYHDVRIKIFKHQNNKKYKYLNATRACKCNFENAILKASGDYIFLSDQDDVWYPWKIDKQLSMLRNVGGLSVAAFDMGDGELHKFNSHIYKHDVPFFTLKNVLCLYGFSLAFTRDELKYYLPIPSSVTGHDTYIQYSALWRKKLHFIDEPCAIHRYSGKHNVSSFGANNVLPPLPIKIYFRLITYLSVIWRSMVRR